MSTTNSTTRQTIMKVLPWLVTLIVLGYIGLTTDVDMVVKTLKAANWLGFIPVVIVVCLTVFLFDSWCLQRLFSRFNAKVTYKEMLPLKGTSYFLNIINYNAAAAGIALFFRNRKGVPLLEAMGSMLWMNFIDVVALATLLIIALLTLGDSVAMDPSYPTILLGLAGFIYLVLAGSCIYWNYGFDWFFLGKMRSWRIFTAFKRATARDYVFFIGIRTTFVCSYILSQWAAMPFFGLDAGFMELMLYVPVLTLVGTIPGTTIAGLGTVQVLMREFFVIFLPAGPEHELHAHIDAYTTTSILAFILCRILIGYFFMGSVAKDFENRAAT